MPTIAAVMLRVTRAAIEGSITDRGDEFRIMVAQGVAFAREHVYGADLIVFIAPEYFFSRFGASGEMMDGTGGEFAPVTQGQKRDLYAEIKAASQAHPDVLIIGGTIFYTKITRFRRRQLGLNVCPIAIGGEIKYKIYKQMDDRALRDYDPDYTYLAKPGKSDPVFTEHDVTFAVDICADHAAGRAYNFVTAHGANVDVHILVSAGANVLRSKVTAQHFLHCDLLGDRTTGVVSYRTADVGELSSGTPMAEPVSSATQISGVEYVVHRLVVG